MSTPKDTATSTPAKPAPKHDEGKDLRRVHEHKGRVDALRPALGKHVADIDVITRLAEQEVKGSHFKDAADLFRAAEHLSFGLLAASKQGSDVDSKLTESVKAEFQHKLEKAQEHWKKPAALAGIYDKTIADAQKALDGGASQKALELVRAAEALAHVHLHTGGEQESAA